MPTISAVFNTRSGASAMTMNARLVGSAARMTLFTVRNGVGGNGSLCGHFKM